MNKYHTQTGKYLSRSEPDWPEIFNMAAAWFKGVQHQIWTTKLFRFVSFSFRLSVRVAGCCRFPLGGCGAYWGQIQFHTMGIGQGTPWMSCQLIAGPLLMATAHQEQLWGSVSCSRILRHVTQFRPGEPGFELLTFWPVHQLYPLTAKISLINYFINDLPIPLALSTIATIATCIPEPITAEPNPTPHLLSRWTRRCVQNTWPI